MAPTRQPYLVIAIEAADNRIDPIDGDAQFQHEPVGDVIYRDVGETHMLMNNGENRYRSRLIELKYVGENSECRRREEPVGPCRRLPADSGLQSWRPANTEAFRFLRSGANSAATSSATCHPRYARLVSSEGQQPSFGQNGRHADRPELYLKFKTSHDKLPGTEEARKLGCTCRDPARVLAKGAGLRAGWLRDLVSDDCPLHEIVIGKENA